MQYANIMVALGGDRGNTVPRYQVPASEIAVLRAIHGPDAVHDVEPTAAPEEPVLDEFGDATGKTRPVKFNNRAELTRLKEQYAGANTSKIVEGLYPGAAARVFEDLDDLEIPKEHFKAKERMTASGVPSVDPVKSDRENFGATRLPGRTEGASASRAETDDAEEADVSTSEEQKLTVEPKPAKGSKPGDILS
jgi:hypothetical protein